jgi:DNA helicase-2/ATP-dependent DNA helicase PcrA
MREIMLQCGMESVYPEYLAILNDEQREAVFHTGRPLLILAGAGSGKTRVITTKIAWFIREKNIKPWSILAVTFTNKAAKEMASRAALLEPRAVDSMLRTFHSFGAWFLRRNCEFANLDSNFIIYDDTDSVALLSTLFPDKRKEEVKFIAKKIANAKDMNLTPESEGLRFIDSSKEFRKAYAGYEKRLGEMGNVDFGDLIKKPVEILRNNPDVKRRFQERFRVIMVDEYQDANVAQAELLQELLSPETYLCVVGDDDQSIYRFRGAEVRNILEFSEMTGGADMIKLEKNYRSTAHILDLADSVVRNNRGRHGKKLTAERGAGKMPKLGFIFDAESEAKRCGELIINAHKNGAPFSDWAILYRTNAQSLHFENEFVHKKIPYKIVGSLKFYEREEIKDALALLSFLVNPKDEISFRRVINKPSRGIGNQTVEKILAERWNEQDWNIESAIRKLIPALTAKARGGAAAFLAALDAGRAAIGVSCVAAAETTEESASDIDKKKSLGLEKNKKSGGKVLRGSDGLSVCVASLVESAGIVAYHLASDPFNGEARVANLQELVNSAGIYGAGEAGLLEFLERIELDRALAQEDDDSDRVTLITLHNTKGLEFKRVIMTGMEQGLFPRSDKKDDDLEEERRLFYVGATRAMDELYFTSCATRYQWGQFMTMEPSIFLQEADKSKLEISGNIPAGFKIPNANRGHNKNIYNYNGKTNYGEVVHKRKTSSDGRWQIGNRVFNEDHGYGEVIEIKEGEAGPVIKVHFETGSDIKFLSKAQGKKFMKITED